MRRFAFTLIEMLTVIAITAVLMTIIVLPIIQSFNLTRAAEAFSNAQDLARKLTAKISNEIGGAVSVRGTNGLVATTINGNATSVPVHSEIVQVVGQNGLTTDVVVPWTKLDIIPPAQIGPGGAGAFIDPISGKVDPTLKTFMGQTQLPVAPSATMVRYSIGLRDPFNLYNDPYSAILMPRGGGRDNLFTLFRSVVVPYVFVNGTKVVNTALFQEDPTTKGVILDDPRFLVPDRDSAGNILQNSHNLRVYHWLGQTAPFENSVDTGTTNEEVAEHTVGNFAHSVIQTEVSRYDMITPQFDLSTRKPAYDGNAPRLTPLIQFRPSVVSNDPAAGQEALRSGEETDNASAIASDVFKTQYGLWNNAVIRSYPPNYNPGNPYNVGFSPLTGAQGFAIFAYDPTSGGTEFTNAVETFDTYTYDNATALIASGNPVYPFTLAALASNSRSSWLTKAGAKNIFTPYHVFTGTGKIVASFDISEVGVNALPNDPNQVSTRPNMPTQDIPNAPLSPINDQSATIPSFSGTNYDINSCYNYGWNKHAYLQPNIQRFIDLRVTPNEDGTYGPLYPLDVTGQPTNFQTQLPDGSMQNRVRIVPGTDVVQGPDQNPGDHYGHPIRYTRVTGNPGPNEYRINYVDQQEPNSYPASPAMVTPAAYENALGLSATDVAGFNVDTYDPTNWVSATIQPRFKAGYIQLESDPNLPIPQGYISGTTLVPVPFKVDYRFQFTGSIPVSAVTNGRNRTDIFAVDYDTRQLMQVLLTIRNYPQSNLPNPQTVTLKATATLKNVTR